MFYEVEVKSHVRVSPELFKENTKKAVLATLNKKYENFISKDFGFVVGVSEVTKVGDGIIIPGDGAPYYDSSYKLLTFKPEMQEVVLGRINEITDFGAFIDIGACDGMIHVSQAMDDFVSASKSGTLSGKQSKKILKSGDQCRARIIAVSYKEVQNPRIGLTMRQPWLGSLKWIEQDLKPEKKPAKKEAKKDKK